MRVHPSERACTAACVRESAHIEPGHPFVSPCSIVYTTPCDGSDGSSRLMDTLRPSPHWPTLQHVGCLRFGSCCACERWGGRGKRRDTAGGQARGAGRQRWRRVCRGARAGRRREPSRPPKRAIIAAQPLPQVCVRSSRQVRGQLFSSPLREHTTCRGAHGAASNVSRKGSPVSAHAHVCARVRPARAPRACAAALRTPRHAARAPCPPACGQAGRRPAQRAQRRRRTTLPHAPKSAHPRPRRVCFAHQHVGAELEPKRVQHRAHRLHGAVVARRAGQVLRPTTRGGRTGYRRAALFCQKSGATEVHALIAARGVCAWRAAAARWGRAPGASTHT